MTYDELFAFEREIADYTGAPYAVLIDCCTHALELCLRLDQPRSVTCTAFTYVSVIQTLRLLDIDHELTDEHWSKEYQLHGTRIWDSARRFEPDMYRSGQLQCLSFGNTKPLHIGRMGAVLTDDEEVHRQLSMMRSDGRDLTIRPWQHQPRFLQGWHYCPTLEDVARGRAALLNYHPREVDYTYPDLRKIQFFA